jgi:hypothetical protein
MADMAGGRQAETEAPRTFGSRLRYVGPGIVIAVTGVGAGDMVSSLVAGTDFGMVLIWAVVFGALLKWFLTEGIGRWYMASGQTMLEGWHSLGRGATYYFIVYLFIVTFVFGAAVTSTAALAVDAAFPDTLPLWLWAALHGVAAFVIVGVGRYEFFERIMKGFAGLKFGAVVLLAILLAPNLGELALGFVPRIPDGALINVLAIIGGVGGTYSLAAYAYWARERGWSYPSWIPMMRTDVTVGYLLTALFIGLPHRLLGRRHRSHDRGLERRRPPLRRLHQDHPRSARRASVRIPLGDEPILPRFPGLDDLPANGTARPRAAHSTGDRLRLARRPVPAVPRDHTAPAPELQPRGPRVS